MFEVTRFEIRQRIDPAVSMGLYVGGIALFVVLMSPLVADASTALNVFVDSLPDVVHTGFGIESIGTVEGILAVEFYQIVVVLLLGMDVAYTAASAVAQKVQDGRIDFTLSGPVTRWRYVLEMYLSLLPEIVAIGALSFAAIQTGLLVLSDWIAPVDFLVAHSLAIVYLAFCSAVGILYSVSTSDPIAAERRASGTILGLFVLDAVTATWGLEWLGFITPSRHFDPTAILVHGRYDPVGAFVLLVGTLAILAAAAAIFTARDV